jgi:hypothetical protein
MSREIRESDWKLFRELHPIALNRFCDRVLSEITAVTSDATKTPHARYGDIFALAGSGIDRSRALLTTSAVRRLYYSWPSFTHSGYSPKRRWVASAQKHRRLSRGTNASNHAIERTSGSLGSALSMTFHPQPAATRHLASRRSSCSR